MDWLTGMLTGYADRSRKIEDDKLLVAREAAQREAAVFKELINSKKPNIAALAATGLIQNAQPLKRGKGLRGWLGELEKNPIYPRLLEAMNQPEITGSTLKAVPGLAARRLKMEEPLVPGGTTPATSYQPEPQSAALPETSPTEPGAPPLTTPPPAPPQAIAQPTTLPSRLPFSEDPGTYRVSPTPSQRLEAPPVPPSADAGFTRPEPPAAGQDPGFAQAAPVVAQPPPAPPTGAEPPAPPLFSSGVDTKIPRITYEDKPAPALGRIDETRTYGITSPFPTTEQNAADTARGQAVGDIEGKLQQYARMYMAADPTLDPQQAMQKAAAFYEQTETRLSAAAQMAGGMDVVNAARELGYPTPEAAFRIGGPEAYAAVVQRARQNQYDASYNRGLGGGYARFNSPLTPGQAAASGGVVGSIGGMYNGQRVPTAAERTRLQSALAIRQQLLRIRGLLGVLPARNDTLSATFPGWDAWVKERSPYHREQLGQLRSAVANIQALLTRTIQGNVGTQTEKDAERTIQSIFDFSGKPLDPLNGDTQESAKERLDETINFLDGLVEFLPKEIQPQQPGGQPGGGGFQQQQPTAAPQWQPGDPEYQMSPDGVLLRFGVPF